MEIRPYEKGDAPMVRVAYLQGVILQDGTFNYNGSCLWIREGEGDPSHCEPSDLFVRSDEEMDQ